MNKNIEITTLTTLLHKSISEFGDNPSYSILNGENLTYKDLGNRIDDFIKVLNKNGLKKGDKVALLGGSMPNWPISYLSVTCSGRIIVPLLPDFTAFEIANILEHSNTQAIIVSKKLIYKLSDSIRDKMNLIICLDNLEVLKVSSDNAVDPDMKMVESEEIPGPTQPEDIASIIYTSGTSGASKGVMLTHANITSNLQMCYDLYPINQNDIFLSFLPLSHAYECTLGMLYPMTKGASVVYLDKAPTPALLLPALQKVKPTIICSVPLIVEKIYKNKVRPLFTKNIIMQFLYSLTLIRRILHKIAGKKLLQMFGGRLRFFGIGGSKLDGMVEKFLRDAKFPYAIGYGLTECSPLVAGAVNKFKYGTTGPTLLGMEMRIFNPDEHGIGEVQVKGPNIMLGYFKDEVKTKAAFTSDGWFKTKDLGKFDSNKNLYLKGRVDNMLLGANGENIYPEEIESIINENDFVLESLVTMIGSKLVAKIHFNYEQIAAIKDYADIKKNINERYEEISEIYSEKKEHLSKIYSEKYEQLSKKYEELSKKYSEKYPELVEKWKEYRQKAAAKKNKAKNVINSVKENDAVDAVDAIDFFAVKLEKVKRELLEYVNSRVNKSSKLSEIIEQPVPFQKTATQKIKRYIYS